MNDPETRPRGTVSQATCPSSLTRIPSSTTPSWRSVSGGRCWYSRSDTRAGWAPAAGGAAAGELGGDTEGARRRVGVAERPRVRVDGREEAQRDLRRHREPQG